MKPTRMETGPDATPLEVRAHYLQCAVCVRGGCKTPPVPRRAMGRLLAHLWNYPYAPLRIMADMDLIRAHYADVYGGRKGRKLPEGFAGRSADYVARMKDLDVCRRLGIYPNTVLPAVEAYRMLFRTTRTMAGICTGPGRGSKNWPDCPHARRGYFEKVVAGNGANLHQQTEQGEKLKGIWLLLRPRTRAEMAEAKERSARFIMEKADRLFIRPEHLLCILCTHTKTDPLIEDNLVELRRRMEADPSIPVTLSEGCCMVCDPCNIYHPGEHLCYHGHFRNGLRDLMMLRILDLKPGDTLPAGRLYARIYRRLKHLGDVCNWGDGLVVSPLWSSCGGAETWPAKNVWFEGVRKKKVLAGGTDERYRLRGNG